MSRNLDFFLKEIRVQLRGYFACHSWNSWIFFLLPSRRKRLVILGDEIIMKNSCQTSALQINGASEKLFQKIKYLWILAYESDLCKKNKIFFQAQQSHQQQ